MSDLSLKERFEQIAAATKEYEAKMAELTPGLKPYIDAAVAAQRLGLTAKSTPDEIISAFAGAVNIGPKHREAIPSVLALGAPEEIRKAGEDLLNQARVAGNLTGQLVGIIAGLAH